MRTAITRAIEPLRKAGEIGHSLDTAITIYAGDKLAATLNSIGSDLRAIFLVSQLHIKPLQEAPKDAPAIAEVEELAIGVAKAAGEKCARCWIYSTELGTDAEHPTLCPRCTAVIKAMEA